MSEAHRLSLGTAQVSRPVLIVTNLSPLAPPAGGSKLVVRSLQAFSLRPDATRRLQSDLPWPMRFGPHPGPRPDAAPLPDQPALADLRAQYYNDGFAYAGRGPVARCCWMTGLKTLAIDTGEKRTVPPPALIPEKAGECHRTVRPVTSLAHSTSFQFVQASAGWSAGFDRGGRGGPGAASDAEAVLTAGAQRGEDAARRCPPPARPCMRLFCVSGPRGHSRRRPAGFNL